MKIKNYHVAKSIEDAYEVLNKDASNLIIAGGAWLKLSNKVVEMAVDLSNCGLGEITETAETFEIGAMVTLRQIEKNEGLLNHFSGIFNQGVAGVMGVAIRNLATIGGSVAGRYSFSDILTPLLGFKTEVVFHKKGTMSLEDFLVLRGKDQDILTKIIIQKEQGVGYNYKMKKTGLDFAVVNVAITKSDEQIKIAVGARPSISILAVESMKFINAQANITDEVIEETAKKVVDELKFGTNSRGSQEYREQLAYVYVKRGLKEVTAK